MENETIYIRFRPKDLTQGLSHAMIIKLGKLPFKDRIPPERYLACLDKGKDDTDILRLLQHEKISLYGYFFMYDFNIVDGWFSYKKDRCFPTYDGEIDWIKAAIKHIVGDIELEFVVDSF